MTATQIIEERITFPSGELTLSGILAYPAQAEPQGAVLLCSPHPHFAGDMNNNVISALGRGMAADAVTLRFDYRGVGDSEIRLSSGVSVFDYWDRVEQARDYDHAMSDVAAAWKQLARSLPKKPLAAVGYSFGAVVGLMHGRAAHRARAMAGISPPFTRVGFEFLNVCPRPCLLIADKNDFLFSADTVAQLQKAGGPNVTVNLSEGGDHFFRGQETALCEQVWNFIRELWHIDTGRID